MALLTCENLTLGYDGKSVVSKLSFSVKEGDYLCIVGENGSGKSTLIKTLIGLIQPLEGKIITQDGFGKNEIGYLPQRTDVQKDFPASVREIVLSGCLGRAIRPFYTKEDKALAAGNMERLGILSLEHKSFKELSGGQQQRVLLARALCATKKLLLLDEPVAGLDPKAVSQFYSLIEMLNIEDKITVIMISHDISSCLGFASHIFHIGSAKPLFFGSKRDYIQSEVGKAYQSFAGGGD